MTDSGQYETPAWGVRIACLLYETLIVIAVVIVGLILPYSLIAAATHSVASGRLLIGHLVLLLLAYFAWQWTRGGQTLAMKTWRIRLVDIGGAPISPALALLRFALATVGTLFLGVGFFWALADREGRYLHDRLAGTRLIRLPKR